MAAAVRVRRDYEAAQIRVLAKRSKNAAQTRRLLALAAIYDGGSRTEAAKIGGVGLPPVPPASGSLGLKLFIDAQASINVPSTEK